MGHRGFSKWETQKNLPLMLSGCHSTWAQWAKKKLSREEIKLRIGITLSKGGGMLWRGQSKISHESGQVNKSDCERLTAA